MILRNKRWDVGLKAIVLLILTLMIVAPMRNIAYAFSPSEPLEVASPADLLEDEGLANRYVATQAQARTDRVLPYNRYGIQYYYYLLEGAENRVFARSMVQPVGGEPVRVEGRWQPFDAVAFAGPVSEKYEKTFGEAVPAGAWIILLDETPDVFKLSLVAVVPLVVAWLAVLYLLVRGVQGKGVLPGSGPKQRLVQVGH